MQPLTRAAPVAGRHISAGWSRRRRLTPYLFLVPGLLFVIVWVYIPFIQTAWLSLFHGSLVTGPTQFVGWGNYQGLLALPEFQQALRTTIGMEIGIIVLGVFCPLAVGVTLARIGRPLQGLYRTIIFTPFIVAPVAAACLWLWLVNPSQGLLTTLLAQLPFREHTNWLNDPAIAPWVIVVIAAWECFGFSLTVTASALGNIDREVLEAARLDGAAEWQITRSIMLPHLRPTLAFLILYTFVFAGQWTFGPINVLTQGGPFGSTTNLYYALYQFGFVYFNTGDAAAIAMLLVFGLAACLVIGWPIFRQRS